MHRKNIIRILSLALTLVIAVVLGVPSVMAEEVQGIPAAAESGVSQEPSMEAVESSGTAASVSSEGTTKAASESSAAETPAQDQKSGEGAASDTGTGTPLSDASAGSDSKDTSGSKDSSGNTDASDSTGTDKNTDASVNTNGTSSEQTAADTEQAAAEPQDVSSDHTDADDTASEDTSSDTVPAMETNLHAGRDFYESELSSSYSISFSGSFSSIMDEIESRYHKGSADKVMNWQDVLAVYVLQQQKKGVTVYTFDESCKEALARVFVSMNVKQRDRDGNISYTSLSVNDYIAANQDALSEEDISLLGRYSSRDCALLCAAATSAKGFILESLGSDVSAERASVVTAAYSLIGKISYFWGGKSTVIGWDSRWGSSEQVAAAGSNDTGSVRAYGLDCSGFVTWAYVNGYKNAAMQNVIGQGTEDQWSKSAAIDESQAQPGDLVFLQIPNDTSINHVGIIVGKNDNGDWVVIHCNASDNGVVMQEAYSAGFRYIRSPSYPVQ